MTTVAQIERELVDEFAIFDNWMDRYQYLIDMGRALPEFPIEERRDADKVSGCQSQVWLQSSMREGKMHFRAISDAAIVSGLIAVLLRIYDGQRPADIVATEPGFVAALGLDKHLSPSRANGLHAMLTQIRQRAAEVMASA